MNTCVDFIDNGSDKTLISFTGISHGFGSAHFRKEFIGLSKQTEFNIMFVADKEVSWYNTIDVNLIKSKLINQKKVITIGNSMGGYSAIQFASDVNVVKVITFAAQYSVHPHVVPHERRWREMVNKIKQWKYKHLLFNDTTEYYIFSGDSQAEMYHTNMIPHKQNIHKFITKGEHGISKILKTKGILYSLIEDCINNPAEIVAKKYTQDIKYI